MWPPAQAGEPPGTARTCAREAGRCGPGNESFRLATSRSTAKPWRTTRNGGATALPPRYRPQSPEQSRSSVLGAGRSPDRTPANVVLTVGVWRVPVEIKYQRRIDPHRDTTGLRSFIEKTVNNAAFDILITQDASGWWTTRASSVFRYRPSCCCGERSSGPRVTRITARRRTFRSRAPQEPRGTTWPTDRDDGADASSPPRPSDEDCLECTPSHGRPADAMRRPASASRTCPEAPRKIPSRSSAPPSRSPGRSVVASRWCNLPV